MELKVIKNEREFRLYLNEVERLALNDPAPNTADGARLELLTLLVETYERSRFQFEKPDPIAAIQFRMNEQGLRQTDLVSYLGSRSRVSEVLAGKRPLTVQMIRDISNGLGISANVLVGPTTVPSKPAPDDEVEVIEWRRFPLKEMARNRYFENGDGKSDESLADLARSFYERVFPSRNEVPILARKSLRGDAVTLKSRYALFAWKARVLEIARKRRIIRKLPKFLPSALDAEFLRRVAQTSWHPTGPKLAREMIEDLGIVVVFERHLTGTHLDGAAMLDRDGNPIIGLTLRMDRLDSFWFTLMHELAHVLKHLSNPGDSFLDRLDDFDTVETLEIEANRIARDTLIPRASWRRSELVGAPSVERIQKLSRELLIHPSIVAGRLRRETGNFRVFGDLLGQKGVGPLFVDESVQGFFQ